ncbi:MAG: hypothetical protein FGM15_01550 [Chthoniobacterales bacterium]|nr:hypothetical protein [Chthoniobacterales bacterium]
MKPPVGTTFVVAASLLGAAAVAQLVAVLIYFGPGFAQTTGSSAVAPAPTPQPPVAKAPEPLPSPPPDNSAEAMLQQERRLGELMKEVETLESGPTPDAALVPLEEAVTLQPRNPEILMKLASLHEKLGQSDLAQGVWKNLLDLGPAAGQFLDVAEVRLRLLKQDSAAPASAAALRDQVGLQPGSSLGVVDLTVKDGKQGAGQTKDLRLAVKARPGETIDARDVRINVTFYELVDGEIIPTMSRVQSMWFTTPVDWRGDGIEILEVKYELPRVGRDGGPAPQYYGYMVNIYHRGQLQETRADPVTLQELFPPPLSEIPDAGGAEQGAQP